MYFRYTALLQGRGWGCFRGFSVGEGVRFSRVSAAAAAVLQLRLRWQHPGQCPCTQTSTAILNWGVSLSWGVRAQPSHIKSSGQNCQVQDLCIPVAPLKLDCTEEKWLDFIVLPIFCFYSVELLMGFARWHYQFMLLNKIIARGVFPCGTSGKEATCQCRRCKRWGLEPWVGKTP